MSAKTGGVPARGTKQNHMVAKGQLQKDAPGGQHHPHHPNANHVATGHHSMGKTIPSFHEKVNMEAEAEARATRHSGSGGLAPNTVED